jgi:hypothetical protein
MDYSQDAVRLVVDQAWHQQLELLGLELELHLQVLALTLQLAGLLQLALRQLELRQLELRQLEPPLF